MVKILKYFLLLFLCGGLYAQGTTNVTAKVVEVWWTNDFVALTFECENCLGRTVTVWKACTVEDGWYSQTDVVINASTGDIPFRSNIICTNSGFLMISVKE